MKKRIRKIRRKWWQNLPTGKLHQLKDGDVVCSDALLFLLNLRDNIADIIFLDPPFNLGKRYGSNGTDNDHLDENKYFEFMTKIISRSVEVLKDGGALYLYHIPRWAVRFAEILQKNLEFRNWIAISMKNGFVLRNNLYPAHYALLYFTKGKPANFNRPKIPVPRCRHCKNYIKDYGGYKKYVENGINLSDIWDDISPVRHKKYKNRQANELPMEIPNRVVVISGKKNGVLVDPFIGTGSSLIAARNHKMKFVGCDNDEDSVYVTIKRLSYGLNSLT